MHNIYLTDINFFAVLVAWIIHTTTGLIWFQPKLFGKEWSKLTGKELNPAKKWIIPGFAGHLVMIFVLVIIIKLANINNGPGGLFVGLLCWIGFIVPMEIGELVWEKIPFRLFLIRIGNQLVGTGISGLILGSWQ
jgi:Protein of unknown function (DUF1761)